MNIEYIYIYNIHEMYTRIISIKNVSSQRSIQ